MEMVFGVVIVLMLTLALMSVSVAQMMLVFLLLVIVISFFLVLWMFVPREVVQHPDHILDVAHAFRWTVDHIHEYGGDPNRIYVMGHSAGGHLAALLSTNFHYLDATGVKPDRVRGCIAVSGVYSDQRMKASPLGEQLLINAFGLRDHYYDAFPIYNVTDNTPPFLLLNAGVDLSLKRHTFDLHYVLRAAGVYVETEYFEDKSHWNIMDDWDQKHNPVRQKILAFLKSTEEYHAWRKTEAEAKEDKKHR
jgi:acetyl esterase/lipase